MEDTKGMKLKDMTMLKAYQAGRLDKWIVIKFGSLQNYLDIKVKEIHKALCNDYTQCNHKVVC